MLGGGNQRQEGEKRTGRRQDMNAESPKRRFRISEQGRSFQICRAMRTAHLPPGFLAPTRPRHNPFPERILYRRGPSMLLPLAAELPHPLPAPGGRGYV
jgi:hypothetical protein